MRLIDGDIRSSMRPSNILVHGRSGSGKTEIFRKISKVYGAPFIRVEATRYTEVGYHGDDITNVISDLFKKTQTEMGQREGESILQGSKTLKHKIGSRILRYMLGPLEDEHPLYDERLRQLERGELDEYTCLLYFPGDHKKSQVLTEMKVKELRR